MTNVGWEAVWIEAGSVWETVIILTGWSLTVPDAAARDTPGVRHRNTAGAFEEKAVGAVDCGSPTGAANVR